MLFWLYNELDAPSRSYENQSLSDAVQLAETGSFIARFLIIILGSIGALLLVRYRARIRIAPWIAGLLFAFLAWSAMTVFWSTDPSLSTRRIVSLAFMSLFAAGCAARMNTFSLSSFFAGIPIIAIIPGIIAEIRYGRFQPLSGSYRFAGTAPHPNVQASSLAVATVALCWLSWWTRGVPRVRIVLTTIVVGAFLMLTGSRTAITAAIAAVAFSAVLIIVRDYKRVVPFSLAVFCLILGLSLLFRLAFFDDPARSLSSGGLHASHGGGEADTLNGRVDLWETLSTYVMRRPWGGYGYGSFWSPEHIQVISERQGWTLQQSHSAYIDQALALGIPGALLYVLLLLSCLVRCVRLFVRRRDGYGAWAAIFIFILIHNLTESINVSTGFTNLVILLIVFHLATVELDRPNYHDKMTNDEQGFSNERQV
jgi:O-antigen ligase